jgi:HSP20 family molecular chaperone IbpA
MPTASPKSHTMQTKKADRPHGRPRQPDTFFGVVLRKEPSQKAYPNHLDVDIRDVSNHYIVDVDLPGVDDPNSILLSWISRRSLTVSRSTFRASHQGRVGSPDVRGFKAAAGDSDSVEGKTPLVHDSETDEPRDSWHNELLPWLALEEQRTRSSRRDFYFPIDADMSKTKATLGVGLLHLKVPKMMHSG